MGVGFRVFFIDSDDRLRRVPLKRFERLVLHNDSPERFPEYAGRRVRVALIALELEDRKPISVNFADYSVIKFDDEGKLDAATRQRSMRLGMDMVSSLYSAVKDGSVIDASGRFYKKQYEREFRWKPSPEVEEAIARAIVGGKDERPPLRLV